MYMCRIVFAPRRDMSVEGEQASGVILIRLVMSRLKWDPRGYWSTCIFLECYIGI